MAKLYCDHRYRCCDPNGVDVRGHNLDRWDRCASVDLEWAVSAYNTPTVVQFATVLLLAGILSAPWQTLSSLSLLLGVVGLGMVFYSIIVLRRMRRVPNYQSTLEDWLGYLVFPLLAHVLLIVAAFVLPENPAPALYIVGSGMILLLLVGIRSARDMVTFLAVERAHSEKESRLDQSLYKVM